MTFNALHESIQDSEPREFCEITHGSTTYRIAFGNRDLVVGSTIYTAEPSARGEIEPAGAGKPSTVSVTLPINHAFVKRYLQQATPPKSITCVITCAQSDGSTEQQWTGYVQGISVDDDNTEATFRVLSRAAKTMLRVLPTVTAGRKCPLVWGGTRCGVTKASYAVTANVLLIDGYKVRVNLSTVLVSDPYRAKWARGGELKHAASGETMTILEQDDLSPGVSTIAVLTLQAQVIGMQVGDSVTVYPGCSREISECSGKYANKNRFGGFPQLPTQNPFTPSSWGVVKS